METYITNFLANKSDNTKIAYEYNLKQMLEFVDKPLNDITYGDLTSYREHFQTEYSYGSMAQKIRCINAYFDYLHAEREVIDNNPTYNKNHKKFAPVKVDGKADKREFTYYDMEDIKTLIEAGKNPRDKAIIATFVTTGLRVTELINLTLDNYQNGECVIFAKGHKAKAVRFNATARKYIDEYLKVRRESECNALFVSNQNTKMRPEALNRTLKNIAKRAGLEGNIHNHSLRHTAISEICKNFGLATAQNFAGHSSSMTTQHYVHSSDRELAMAMDSISF